MKDKNNVYWYKFNDDSVVFITENREYFGLLD